MRNPRLLKLISALFCVVLVGGALLAPVAVLAQEEEETTEPTIPDIFEANPKFPSMTGPADSTFKFEVEFTYRSREARGATFDLAVTGPPGWLTYIAESTYKLDNQISAIFLEPYSVKEPVVVVAVAPFWLYPEPGDYPIELRASSGDLQDVITMTATITARYGLTAETTSGQLNTKTTATKPATLGVKITNSGTATMDKVMLSSTTPSGIGGEEWLVTYEPESIENLGPGDSTEVEVSITPPANTVAGDYMVTLDFTGEPALSSSPPSLAIRVSVAASTAWGIVGALVVVAVIGGLVWAFRKYGRR
ncbi:MAG: hypothetical protein JXA58_01230 [Dehalococcoidia bacterium]|nr:hypothetical protein [Dehalococcoidia bacterium]